jgi:hypothetical protein
MSARRHQPTVENRPSTGEPLEELKKARSSKAAFRFDGGSLHVWADGTLALYCGWNPGPQGAAERR